MDTAGQSLKHSRLYDGILLLLPLVVLALVRWVWGFNGLYGQDAHRYYQYIGELEVFFSDGTPQGEFHWPVLYPLMGLIFKWLFQINGAVALQLVSALSMGVSSLILFKILKPRDQGRTFIFTLLFMFLAPQMLIAGVLCMSDLFAAMWVLLSWYFYRQYQTKREVVYVLALSATAALAVISRYPAILLVMFPLAAAFFSLATKNPWQALWMPLIFLFFCLPEFLFHPTIENLSGNYFLQHWSFGNFFAQRFETIDGSQNYRFVNIVYMTYPFWHPTYFLLGIGFALFVFYSFPPSRPSWLLIIAILVYLFFLGGLPVQARRFFILVFPLILILVYENGMGAWFHKLSRKALLLLAVFIGIGQLAVTVFYGRDYIRINQFEQELAKDLKPYEGKVLYGFYWDGAVKSYNLDFHFHNLWQRRYYSYSPGDLVLFNPHELKAQWEGYDLMENWKQIREEHTLKVMEEWDNGWKLYEIQ